jgi:hypothetical protein
MPPRRQIRRRGWDNEIADENEFAIRGHCVAYEREYNGLARSTFSKLHSKLVTEAFGNANLYVTHSWRTF